MRRWPSRPALTDASRAQLYAALSLEAPDADLARLTRSAAEPARRGRLFAGPPAERRDKETRWVRDTTRRTSSARWRNWPPWCRTAPASRWGSLHRGPFGFVRELIRQGKRDLELIKQSPGYDVDILCRAGALRVRAGIVAMEGNFGLAPWYRKAIERGEVELEEHACASLTAACGRRRSACRSSPAAACMAAACPN